jgi:hypothetical protein
MEVQRFLKTVLNMKLKGKCPRRGRQLKWKQLVRKYITQKVGSTCEKAGEQELCEDNDRWRGFVV